jgi:uncharacterized protein (TIGR02118 family)
LTKPLEARYAGRMVKLVFCLRRRADLTHEAFTSYWLDVHGPKVRSHAAALGSRRYVQTHTRHGEDTDAVRVGRGGLEPFDGVAELWFDSIEAMRAATGTTSGRAAGRALLEDERRFLDLDRCALWVGDEHQIIPLAEVRQED